MNAIILVRGEQELKVVGGTEEGEPNNVVPFPNDAPEASALND